MSEKQSWEKVLITPNITIKRALKVITDGALRIALVVDKRRRLLGTVSDGDIRRGLLRRVSLTESVQRIMNTSPRTVQQGVGHDDVLATMRSFNLLQIPVLDAAGRVVGLETFSDALEIPQRNNWVLLMAGGYGTRLRPLTDSCPKPMLPVGGRPILENILEGFLAAGYHRFYFSVHYRRDMIQKHFGDGSRWNATIRYIEERQPLGTAGALSLLPTIDGMPLIVMNADLLTRLNFADLLDYHEKFSADVTMCVREYDFQVPFGVIHSDGDKITKIVEKPMYVYFVNAGIYVLSPDTIRLAKRRKRLDMPDLIQSTIERKGKVIKYPIHEYWLDIGRVDDLERAQSEYMSK